MKIQFKKLSIVIFLSLLPAHFVFSSICFADNTEQEFKNICSALGKYAAENMSSAGEKDTVSNKEKEEKHNHENQLIKGWRAELESFAKANPNSIWADDAFYIITSLSMEDPKERSRELEYLIEKYPKVHIEDWTRKALPFMMPRIPISVVVRLELISDYKRLGEQQKAKEIYEKSINEYSEYQRNFERAYKDERLSEEELKKARADYNKLVDEQKERFA